MHGQATHGATSGSDGDAMIYQSGMALSAKSVELRSVLSIMPTFTALHVQLSNCVDRQRLLRPPHSAHSHSFQHSDVPCTSICIYFSCFVTITTFPHFLRNPHAAVFMSFTPEPELPLHAPWYVEGDFNVSMYYYGWRDISDPPTPATSEHETTHSVDMSAVSDLTMAYILDDGEDERFQQLQMRIHCHMNPSELVLIAAPSTHPAECIAKDFLRNGGCDADQLSTLLGRLTLCIAVRPWLLSRQPSEPQA